MLFTRKSDHAFLVTSAVGILKESDSKRKSVTAAPSHGSCRNYTHQEKRIRLQNTTHRLINYTSFYWCICLPFTEDTKL